jgi:hypothetical protein
MSDLGSGLKNLTTEKGWRPGNWLKSPGEVQNEQSDEEQTLANIKQGEKVAAEEAVARTEAEVLAETARKKRERVSQTIFSPASDLLGQANVMRKTLLGA